MALVSPDEMHQFRNTGDTDFSFAPPLIGPLLGPLLRGLEYFGQRSYRRNDRRRTAARTITGAR